MSFAALHADRLEQGETRWTSRRQLPMRTAKLLRAVARSFLAGEQTVDAIVSRASVTLGREWRFLHPLAVRYLEVTAHDTRPRLGDVIEFLKWDSTFLRVRGRLRRHLTIETWLTETHRMQPVAAATAWDLPRIETIGDLCNWLWLDAAHLDWFADLKSLNLKAPSAPLDHYSYRALQKPDGSLRLIEAPKRRLKRIQRQILTGILDRVPPHPAAHGFVHGRSIRSFAAPHTGQPVVLRIDLADFFPSFHRARIQTLFRTLGYPEPVADLLGGLCTHIAPLHLLTDVADREVYGAPHLPQGAPTSPALANMCCYRIDCRLSGLAKVAGANYTRYADDLAFSGGTEFDRGVGRFATHVASILLEEGFRVNHRKTRIMRRGVRQHLAGLTINHHTNVNRRDFDSLKAILTNCIRHGPGTQNRDAHPNFRAHLEGRVAFVHSINPERAQRLQALFQQIGW